MQPLTRRPVVLDVDTGVDDALALLFAARHPALDLRAVTCVAGNADVDQVVRNTLTVLESAGRADVPVARGADRPLLEQSRGARHVHGEDGMADLGWPVPHRRADPRHAVELLRDVLLEAAGSMAGRPAGPAVGGGRAGDPDGDADDAADVADGDPVGDAVRDVLGDAVTLVPLGPLTNIALLLRTYPESARGLRKIVFMGGAARVGNATASAEFNVWHDPEAAAVVLQCAQELGIDVVMYGLDVFYDVRVGRAAAERLVAVGGRGPQELAGRLLQHQCERFATDDATVGDAGAVCSVADPAGLSTTALPVHVELAGAYSRGRTVVDSRPEVVDRENDPHALHGRSAAIVDVALGVDGPRYARLWLDTVRGAAQPLEPEAAGAAKRRGAPVSGVGSGDQ